MAIGPSGEAQPRRQLLEHGRERGHRRSSSGRAGRGPLDSPHRLRHDPRQSTPVIAPCNHPIAAPRRPAPPPARTRRDLTRDHRQPHRPRRRRHRPRRLRRRGAFRRAARLAVLALSAAPPELPAAVRHLPVDLTDAEECRRALGRRVVGDPRPVRRALRAAGPHRGLARSRADGGEPGDALRNLLDAVEPASPALAHVTLLQGTKAYGSHVEPARVPAKQRWPRHPHRNFCWLQEDLLRERAPRGSWTFTILRPQAIFRHAVGSPMNAVAAVGALRRDPARARSPARVPRRRGPSCPAPPTPGSSRGPRRSRA